MSGNPQSICVHIIMNELHLTPVGSYLAIGSVGIEIELSE
jgi:hypothetical protein